MDELYLDLTRVRVYGFSHEGAKNQAKVDSFRYSIQRGIYVPAVWVSMVDNTNFALVNSTDVPNLPIDNLAGHHRAIARLQENSPLNVIIVNTIAQLPFHADTLIADVKLF